MIALHRTVAVVVAVSGMAVMLSGVGQPPAKSGTVAPPAGTRKPDDPSLAEVRQEGIDVARELKKLAEQYRSAWEKNPDKVDLVGRFPKELRANLDEFQTRVRGLLAAAPGTTGTVVGHAKADATASPPRRSKDTPPPAVGDPTVRQKQAELTGKTHRAPDPALMQARAREALLKELDKSADRVKVVLDKLAEAMKEGKPEPIKDRFKDLTKAIDALELVAKGSDRKD